MSPQGEKHFSHRIGLLRAIVLGANDGIISTACLILGVAAADATGHAILVAGTAGLVAGAASMAIGEYVSVSSQRDSEQADIKKEIWELENTPEREFSSPKVCPTSWPVKWLLNSPSMMLWRFTWPKNWVFRSTRWLARFRPQ
jgi:hypothetical protein